MFCIDDSVINNELSESFWEFLVTYFGYQRGYTLQWALKRRFGNGWRHASSAFSIDWVEQTCIDRSMAQGHLSNETFSKRTISF